MSEQIKKVGRPPITPGVEMRRLSVTIQAPLIEKLDDIRWQGRFTSLSRALAHVIESYEMKGDK